MIPKSARPLEADPAPPSPDTGPAVEVHDLSKAYGNVIAADRVGFHVEAGEILGLLGPNGAGKTTVLECVEGLRRPDRGSIRVAGLDPARSFREARRVMGVQLQVSALPDAMSPEEAMGIICAYHGVPPRLDLLDRFGLESKRTARYETLSTGQKRRLAQALAIAHKPRVLFLDEPTAGLDVASRTELHQEIMRLRADGAAVVLATHDMAEAEKLCDRLCIMLKGRIVATGTPREVTSTGAGVTRVLVRTEHDTFASEEIHLPASTLTARSGQYAEYLTTDAAATVTALLEEMTSRNDHLVDLRVERPSLEERFLELTQEAPAP